MIDVSSPYKVYGIYKGCVYEGGSCLREVFSNEDKARAFALQLVDQIYQTDLKNKSEMEEHGEEFEVNEWIEKKHNYWTDEYTVIAVKEFILVS